MSTDLAKLVGALNAIAESTDNKDLKAALIALLNYLNSEKPMGFVDKGKG